jgi:hypothetical protein
MAVVEPTNTAFLTILPQAITYAENRMYREIDFLFTSIANTDYSRSRRQPPNQCSGWFICRARTN